MNLWKEYNSVRTESSRLLPTPHFPLPETSAKDPSSADNFIDGFQPKVHHALVLPKTVQHKLVLCFMVPVLPRFIVNTLFLLAESCHKLVHAAAMQPNLLIASCRKFRLVYQTNETLQEDVWR